MFNKVITLFLVHVGGGGVMKCTCRYTFVPFIPCIVYVIADIILLHVQCMRNILAVISCDDLMTLLEKSRDEALSCTTS